MPSMTLPRLLIATGNPGKLREYRQLLKWVAFELVSLDHLGITQEVDENGLTFRDNARLKALAYGAMSGLPTLADDSGLEVNALGGDPGVHSARYGGDACNSDEDRVRLLLENLRDVPWEQRMARFRCVIAISFPSQSSTSEDGPENLAFMVGSVAGMIQYNPMGNEGFGYDPVFHLPSYGRTMSQLTLPEKNRVSHRADAARKALAWLDRLTGQAASIIDS